ncbi:MAG: mannose-1-phosphate guanylyltransferase [Planctomycetota bacterium]
MTTTPPLHAIILAGGSGTRFWPHGRRTEPKILLPLGRDGECLLRATVDRVGASVGSVRVVTGADQADAVASVLPELAQAHLLREPAARDTAAAIAWALASVRASGANDTDAVAVLPADHHIADVAAFRADLAAATQAAVAHDRIVTFGIHPDHAATGYGYIRTGELLPGGGAYEVAAFVEKPDAETAARYLAEGRYLWNAGMFIATVGRLWSELAAHMPALTDAVEALPAPTDAAFGAAFAALPKTSIDYGVMERSSHVATIAATFDWSDVGSWHAVQRLRLAEGQADGNGNVVANASTDVIVLDSRDCYLQTDAGVLAVIGLDDIVVVRHGNAVLVCPRDRSEDVRRVVEELRRRGRDDMI